MGVFLGKESVKMSRLSLILYYMYLIGRDVVLQLAKTELFSRFMYVHSHAHTLYVCMFDG